MTYTFKLARRLAQVGRGGLLAITALTLACGADDSTLGPGPSEPPGIEVFPQSATVPTDGEVQFGVVSGASSTTALAAWRSPWRRPVVRLDLDPGNVRLAAGGVKDFDALGRTASGKVVTPSVRWTATGGTVDGSGKYTAGRTAGNYRVIATTTEGVADTAVVTVTSSSSTVSELVLTPASVTLASGTSKQFTAAGKASDGSSVAVTATYQASGGTITANGLFTAGSTAGNFRVIATDPGSNKTDTSAVTITTAGSVPSPTLQAVVLTPITVSLAAGATQQFAASGKMSDGSTSAVTVTWSASGGTISSAGLYTAGSVAGSYRVIATQTGGTLADTSAVTVTLAPPPPPPPPPSPPPAGNLPTPLRTVNVATTSELISAIQNAQPGDRIVMAAGTYNLASFPNGVASRSGTATNPIVVTGPRTAVLSGGGAPLEVTGNYWILNGFRITNVVNSALQNLRGNHNVFEYLELDHTGSHALAIRTGPSSETPNGVTVTGNVIRYNYIHDTGTALPHYGEGIYLGDGWGNQRALNTHIHHNTIGPNIGAEAIEAKVSTDGNTIEFNTISGGYMVIRSDNNVVNDNTLAGRGPNDGIGANGNALIGVGSDVPGDVATNNTMRRNKGSNEKFLFFNYGTGNQFSCDNVVTAPAVLGVTCTQ